MIAGLGSKFYGGADSATAQANNDAAKAKTEQEKKSAEIINKVTATVTAQEQAKIAVVTAMAKAESLNAEVVKAQDDLELAKSAGNKVAIDDASTKLAVVKVKAKVAAEELAVVKVKAKVAAEEATVALAAFALASTGSTTGGIGSQIPGWVFFLFGAGVGWLIWRRKK